MRSLRVVIVGGGIGGMAFAAAVQRLGGTPLVLERAPQIAEVGSGLGILPGAVRALEAIGVGASRFGDTAPLRVLRVCAAGGAELREIDFRPLFARAGRGGFIVHRAALHAAITSCVDPASIRTGAEVVAIDADAGGVRVHIAGTSEPIAGDLVVGADGLRSLVREHVLADGPPRYAGETIFRGIAPVELDEPAICREVLGAGSRAAYYDLGAGRCYWWATAPLPAGIAIAPAERSAYLQERFATWRFGLPALFAKTPSETILQNDIYDRPRAPRWHRGRAVLLGDAAHPTTPNLGQGACMAIEDAVVLARALAETRDVAAAFVHYEKARIGRAAAIARMSRLWGAVGLWQRAPLVSLRDAFYRRAPQSWFERALRFQYEYDPGTLPLASRAS